MQLPRGNQERNMKDEKLLIEDSVKSTLTNEKANAIYRKMSLNMYPF